MPYPWGGSRAIAPPAGCCLPKGPSPRRAGLGGLRAETVSFLPPRSSRRAASPWGPGMTERFPATPLPCPELEGQAPPGIPPAVTPPPGDPPQSRPVSTHCFLDPGSAGFSLFYRFLHGGRGSFFILYLGGGGPQLGSDHCPEGGLDPLPPRRGRGRLSALFYAAVNVHFIFLGCWFFTDFWGICARYQGETLFPSPPRAAWHQAPAWHWARTLGTQFWIYIVLGC